MLKKEIYTFIHTAELNSFHKAAETLFLTPAAVMKQINALEAELNMPLFHRTNHGVSLTEFGKQYYTEVKKLQKQADASIQKLLLCSSNCFDTLRIATSQITPSKAFLDIYQKVSNYFPTLDLKLIPLDPNKDMYDSMQRMNKDFDLIVTMADSYEWQQKYMFYPLDVQHLHIAVPITHPLAKKEKLTASDLSYEHIVITPPDYSPVIDDFRKLLSENPIHWIHELHYAQFNLSNKFADNGYLLVNAPDYSVLHPNFITLPFEPTFEFPYGFLYTKEVKELVEKILSVYETTS